MPSTFAFNTARSVFFVRVDELGALELFARFTRRWLAFAYHRPVIFIVVVVVLVDPALLRRHVLGRVPGLVLLRSLQRGT